MHSAAELWDWYVSNFFGFEGRLRRLRFLGLSLVHGLCTSLLIGVLVTVTAKYSGKALYHPIATPLLLAVTALSFAVNISLLVRRFHDFDWSGYGVVGWFFGLIVFGMLQSGIGLDRSVVAGVLIIIAYIAWSLLPLIIPGTTGKNRFGPSVAAASENSASRKADFSANNQEIRAEVIDADEEVADKVADTWNLIRRYDPVAQEFYEKALIMGQGFGRKFVLLATSQPPSSRDWGALLSKIKAEFDDQLGIIATDPILFTAYQLIEPLGDQARAEFIRTVQIVGPSIDTKKLVSDIMDKYQG
jgi:uncharacterized membrane protein YhaH (DUF805 family)